MEKVLEGLEAREISVRGVVQGVGFRPFIYRLAREHNLKGYVYNTSEDVNIVIEGQPSEIDEFINRIQLQAPPQSRIESISVRLREIAGFTGFEIQSSRVKEQGYQLLSPDIATCPACLREIFDPADRRYRYPFTNCTNCGPRFTIIKGIPYDRSQTTMDKFKMCPDCQREYEDPANRRFHAQPDACPQCGPRLQLTDHDGKPITVPDVISEAARLIREGRILAVKGLGGFLLACDAVNDSTVRLLRERKNRPDKPLAVMFKDVTQARKYCHITDREAELLHSSSAPIVLAALKMSSSCLSPLVAPGLNELGIMLPYTPLHHLLLAETDLPLIMTSGNLSEEPIAADNTEALTRLGSIADYFILHDRDIYSRYDDSVFRVEGEKVSIIRRARGLAPYPVHLSFSSRPVLACGADLKNTFCLTRDNFAFVSQHIGDMENEETLEHFEKTLANYRELFHIQPEIIACDLHPDYLPSKWAETEARKMGLPLVRVQHHYAHILSCMADNQVGGPVIGVSFDGTGYGTDGRIWGGEFLIADYRRFQRKAYLEYLPLPGGSAAIKRPYRTMIGYLYSLFGPKALDLSKVLLPGIDPIEIDLIKNQIDRGLNAPLTSSCGRLFDAVSSLLGIVRQVSYEGQGAMELEALADNGITDACYPIDLENRDGVIVMRLRNLFLALRNDLNKDMPVSRISAIFHNTLADLIGRVSRQLADESGIRQVALSGGVFQNRRLLKSACHQLEMRGLVPLVHSQVPCNDGGISLGQAVAVGFTEGSI